MMDRPPREPFPPYVRDLFWETDPTEVELEVHRDYVIGRVLVHGGLDAIRWLRRVVGDPGIRDFLSRTHGRALGKRDLRFCETLFDLPHDTVTSWLRDPARRYWDGPLRTPVG